MTTYNAIAQGAAGDGSTDDHGVLQATLDAMVPGDKLYLPAARYRVNDTLNVPTHVCIFGDGAEVSTLELGPAVSPEKKLLEIISGASGMGFHSFGCDGLGASKNYNADGELIHCNDISDSVFRDLLLVDAVSEGLDLDKAVNCHLVRIRGKDCGGNLIHSGSLNDSERVTVDGAFAENCSHRRLADGKANPYAIRVSGYENVIKNSKALDCANGIGTIDGADSRIEMCFVDGGAIGIHSGGATTTGCVVKNTTSRGIAAPIGAIGNTVLGGASVTSVGIEVTNYPPDTISHNSIHTVKNTGISISGWNAKDGTMIGNRIFGTRPGKYAVHFNAQADQTGWVVDGNNFGGGTVLLPSGVWGENRP